MISEEECELWRKAVTSPDAMEAYAAWLSTHDPVRARYQKDAWAAALGITGAYEEMELNPFPTRIDFAAARIGEAGPLCDRLPFIEVRLAFPHSFRMSREDIAAVFANPVVAKIRSLSFRACCEEMDPDDNGQSLVRTYYGEPVLEALCASPNLRNLEALSFGGEETGARCGSLLAGARFERLRRLTVFNEQVGDAGAIALAGSPVVATLERLYLSSCQIGTAGALALASSPNLGRLEELYLRNNKIGAEGTAALRSSFASLRSLEL